MSERIIRFLLSEVKTLRIICKRCKAVVETPLESSSDALGDGLTCRFCNKPVKRGSDHPRFNPFESLEAATKAFKEMESDLEVQFVFPGD